MVSINPLFIFWTTGCSISSWSKGCITWCQSYWTRWCSLTGRLISSDILCLTWWSDKELCFVLALPGLLILCVYVFHVTVIHCLLLLFLTVLSIYRVFYITLVLYLKRREKLKTVLKKTRCRFKIVYTLHQILHVVLCLVQNVNWLQDCDLRKLLCEVQL